MWLSAECSALAFGTQYSSHMAHVRPVQSVYVHDPQMHNCLGREAVPPNIMRAGSQCGLACAYKAANA